MEKCRHLERTPQREAGRKEQKWKEKGSGGGCDIQSGGSSKEAREEAGSAPRETHAIYRGPQDEKRTKNGEGKNGQS